ncbi:MAB_1171c family putative transporter [Streptomyces lavendulocolor]|uniref:MAB_1171c family putative transporter n=1 Tax=Streptomyces lavendulocolor TaxID=67316 RepID=A0ABV2W8S4_9ACTN
MRSDPGASFAALLSAVSIIALWGAVFLRASSALRSPNQRGLWLAVATAATAMTLHWPVVHARVPLLDAYGHHLALARNLIGVVSAAAVLHFVTMATASRRLKKSLYVLTAGALTSLVLLDATAPGHHTHTVVGSGAATPSVPYWLVLIGAHLLANGVCVAMCWRYGAQAGTPLLRAALWLFGLGTAVAGLYWAGQLVRVLTGAPWVTPFLTPAMGVHGLLRAAALLVPAMSAVRRAGTDIATIWRLSPLWRELIDAVPAVALSRPRPRVLDVVWPLAPWRLVAYRKVIETRDAILILHGHVDPGTLDAARAQAARTSVPDARREAHVLACVLRTARAARSAGLRQEPPSRQPAGPGPRDLADERRFLLNVAEAYRAPETARFAARTSAALPDRTPTAHTRQEDEQCPES